MPLSVSTGSNLTVFSSTGIILALFSFIPKNLGIEGPVISPSNTPTEYPFFLNIEATIPVIVDFPTPPLPLITPIIFLTLPYLGNIFKLILLDGHVFVP